MWQGVGERVKNPENLADFLYEWSLRNLRASHHAISRWINIGMPLKYNPVVLLCCCSRWPPPKSKTSRGRFAFLTNWGRRETTHHTTHQRWSGLEWKEEEAKRRLQCLKFCFLSASYFLRTVNYRIRLNVEESRASFPYRSDTRDVSHATYKSLPFSRIR